MSQLYRLCVGPRIAFILSLTLFSATQLTQGRSIENKWQKLQADSQNVLNLDKDHHHVSGSVLAIAGDAGIRLQFLPTGEPVPAAAQVVAQAAYVDSLHTKSNFGKLRVVANDDQHVGHELRYRAAGFAEGFLTAGAIWDHFRNTRDYFKTDLYPGVDIWDAPIKWLHEQEAWVMQQLAAQAGSTNNINPSERSSSSSSSSSSGGGEGSSGRSTLSEVPSSSSSTGNTKDVDAPHAQIWVGVALQMAQFNGIVEGYAARRQEALRLLQQQGQSACSGGGRGGGEGGASSTGAAAGSREGMECAHHVNVLGHMSRDDHLFLQNNGELYDIVDGLLAGAWGRKAGAGTPGAVHGGGRSSSSSSTTTSSSGSVSDGSSSSSRDSPSRSPLSPGRWLQDLALKGHCSALIKVAADLSDIYVGHATWDSYTQALRIYKHYDLGGPGFGRLSFSSYPGETFSDDDFYLSESGLIVLETTDHIFNPNVYAGLSTQTLLSWQRVRTALMLAQSGEEWLSIFKYKNSGTYNNQYMVVDLKKFEPKQRLAPGLFWVVEQLPGMIEAGDMTDVLARGHWGSYNVPSFTKICVLRLPPAPISTAATKTRWMCALPTALMEAQVAQAPAHARTRAWTVAVTIMSRIWMA
ncbi:phospholipase B-domain-containing protein [Dunaliella salina]|uniref:Phospholipase B-like n=1 Tax=Dunaliella salina TaxID=3046 RepID=A0ABQ7H5J2_DUNSA|nr:phospholipase B-domain-containing protein [Dunaliella salina]|eukprot:KAF5842106.1 phospholipase B-domain-containing protein [Dunaliella salina]